MISISDIVFLIMLGIALAAVTTILDIIIALGRQLNAASGKGKPGTQSADKDWLAMILVVINILLLTVLMVAFSDSDLRRRAIDYLYEVRGLRSIAWCFSIMLGGLLDILLCRQIVHHRSGFGRGFLLPLVGSLIGILGMLVGYGLLWTLSTG